MKILGKSSRVLSKLLDYIVGLIIIVLILYSSFSLYSSYKLFKGAFASDSLLEMKPVVDPTGEVKPNFDDLKRLNEDVVAWLTVENTNIDYPVLQGENNLEYINKDVYGNFAFEGSLFLDTRNSRNFEDTYSLIYGHHMEHGAMFGDLQKFLDESFFNQNTTGDLITEDGDFEIRFFAVAQADGYDEIVFNPTSTNSENKDEFLAYIDSISVNKRAYDIKPEDKIIGLSTCTSTQTNGRTILFGVLIPKE